MADRKKSKLRRVESKEHLLGEEEYVVVDFIGNVEVTSRRSSTTAVVDPSTLEVEYVAAEDADEDEDIQESTTNVNPPASIVAAASPPESPVSVVVVAAAAEVVNEKVFEKKHQNEEEDKSQQYPSDSSVGIAADIVVAVVPQEAPSKKLGKGLKGLKARRAAKEKQEESPQWTTSVVSSTAAAAPPKTPQHIETSVTKPSLSASSSFKKDRESEPLSLSRSSSSRSSLRSGDDSTTSSRKGSRADRSSQPVSQVLQNKLMFDQQIANQWKRKEPSPEGSHRSSNSSLNSSSRRGSLRSLSEKPALGTVAGARSMFEAKKPPSKPKAAWSVKLESPADDSAAVASPPTTTTTPTKTASTGKKKKRFPFTKKKAATVTTESSSDINNKKPAANTDEEVQLLAVNATPSQQSPAPEYEERAIDVPVVALHHQQQHQDDPSATHQVELSGTKKKKKAGLISRITHRRSRKSSGDGSDVEAIPAAALPLSSGESNINLEKPVSEESPIVSEKERTSPQVPVEETQKLPDSTSAATTTTGVDSRTIDTGDSSLALLAEIDTSLTIKPVEHDSDLIVPASVPDHDDEIPPPSPEQASQEVKSVLESIIDRKPVNADAATLNPEKVGDDEVSPKKKKKKLVLKKRTKSKKDLNTDTVVDDNAEKPKLAAAAEPLTLKDEDHLTVEEPSSDPPATPVAQAQEELIVIKEVKLQPQPQPIHVEIIEENDIEESKVKVEDVSTQDWPEEMIYSAADNNNEISENQLAMTPTTKTKEEEVETLSGGDREAFDTSSDAVTTTTIPQISIEASHDNDDADHENKMQQEDQPTAPFLDVDLHNNDDTISITSSTSDMKKKKRFKFHLRKSSSKKHKKEQQQQEEVLPSPTKDVDIWETPAGEDSKLEKKHSSKKLKRPKSLNFLGEIIHPTHKHKNENQNNKPQRPASVAVQPDHSVNASDTAESPLKSPTKRRSFNLFKKKKHHHQHHDSDHVDSDVAPSPAEDPDVFKIPDVGHVSVGLTVPDQSDHS